MPWRSGHLAGLGAPTRVEMEALTSGAVATLTLYDMCKAISRDIMLEEIKLISKTGGQRGDFLPFSPMAQPGLEMGCNLS